MALYTINNVPGAIDFECNGEPTKRILQNCKNLIMCRMGDVPYDRKRGVNPAVFYMTVAEINNQLMPEIDRVLGWEPRANAVSAYALPDESYGLIITATVEIAT